MHNQYKIGTDFNYIDAQKNSATLEIRISDK